MKLILKLIRNIAALLLLNVFFAYILLLIVAFDAGPFFWPFTWDLSFSGGDIVLLVVLGYGWVMTMTAALVMGPTKLATEFVEACIRPPFE